MMQCASEPGAGAAARAPACEAGWSATRPEALVPRLPLHSPCLSSSGSSIVPLYHVI